MDEPDWNQHSLKSILQAACRSRYLTYSNSTKEDLINRLQAFDSGDALDHHYDYNAVQPVRLLRMVPIYHRYSLSSDPPQISPQPEDFLPAQSQLIQYPAANLGTPNQIFPLAEDFAIPPPNWQQPPIHPQHLHDVHTQIPYPQPGYPVPQDVGENSIGSLLPIITPPSPSPYFSGPATMWHEGSLSQSDLPTGTQFPGEAPWHSGNRASVDRSEQGIFVNTRVSNFENQGEGAGQEPEKDERDELTRKKEYLSVLQMRLQPIEEQFRTMSEQISVLEHEIANLEGGMAAEEEEEEVHND